MNRKSKPEISLQTLAKTPTGISGLDQITGGGIPTGRPTLVCGGTGCGKTLLSLEFLVRGATDFNEPGVFMAFEEKADELAVNVKSLGFDLQRLQKEKKVKVDYVHIDRSEIEETGEYDLSGLFIRLDHAITTLGAKRVVLDTLENIFSGLNNQGILRAEIRRLFHWLKEKKVTTIITGEKGDGALTRQGLEEYVSDCVILLDHRITNQVSTRLLRIVKYRGSLHGTNEYPFLIDDDGISVLPVTSLTLDSKVSSQTVSTGIDSLDQMLGGKGFYKGSSILISGTAGTGKTSIAASYANASCEQGLKCIYFSFEESPQQIIRNMHSIGLDLDKHVNSGRLKFQASRPTEFGLEMHLVAIHKVIRSFKPQVVVLDPITNLTTMGTLNEIKSVLIRLIDFLQTEGITVMFTSLTFDTNAAFDENVSSIVDAWIQVKDIEHNGERNRGLYVIKSRGMKHSNQIREFVITDKGLHLVDVFLGPDGVLVGSARESQQLNDETGKAIRWHATRQKDQEIERKNKVLQSRISALLEEFESTKEALNKTFVEDDLRKEIVDKNRLEMIRKRGAALHSGKKFKKK